MIATAPEEALRKAKINLLTNEGGVFISTIVTQLEHKMTDTVPTAGTNGSTIYYNPDFFMALSPKARVGLLAHEAWHVAFNHMKRIGDRDFELWNAAGDYVINALLIDSGLTIPPEGLYNPIFTGYSTEQVYDYLYQRAEKIPVNYITDIIPSDQDTSEEVTDIINKACISARASDTYGKLPKEITRELEKLLSPQISWVEQLYRYLDVRSREDVSWKSPNKKYLPSCILPSKYSKTLDTVTIAIDTSGSIDKEKLNAILSELNYVNQVYSFTQLTIIGCDCKIHNIYSVNPFDNVMELQFKGGGGTSAMPILDYLKTNPTNLFIYFTDGDMNLKLDAPDCSVLWVIYDNPDFIAPFGEAIFVN